MAATTVKTVEYCWPMVIGPTTVTNDIGTTPDIAFGNITVDIPESTSRAFKSVYIYYGGRDNSTAVNINTISQTRLGLKVDGGSETTFAFTDAIAETDENIALHMVTDVTSWFNTNYTGTSHAVGLNMRWVNNDATNIPVVNCWAKVVITYEYDAATDNATRLKTVRIPIESNLNQLTTTLTEIGTNQVPDLDDLLPESTKAYKDIFFEFAPNIGTNTATDITLGVSLDSESEVTFAAVEMQLQSGTTDRYIWRRTDLDTANPHALKARVQGTAAYDTFGGVLVVTYTYRHDLSTSVMNSLVFPVVDEYGYMEGTVAGDAGVYSRQFTVQEPATVTLKQSGLLVTSNSSVSSTVLIKTGGQSAYRTYNAIAGAPMAGNHTLVHRIDTDSGLTLARGSNTLTVYAYAGYNSRVSNLSMTAIINYTSAIATDDSTHAHTVHHLICATQPDAQLVEVTPTPPAIPEAAYWLVSAGFWVASMISVSTAAFGLEGQNQSGEWEGSGWTTYGSSIYIADNERGPSLMVVRAVDFFRRHPGSTVGQNIETSRKYRFYSTTAPHTAIVMLYTYHSITSTISGTVSGYADADGAGLTVDLWNATTGQWIASTTTTAGGEYSFDWYDDVDDYFTTCRENATHVGRSDNFNF